MTFNDLTGKRFGRLTVAWVAGRGAANDGPAARKHPIIHWLCFCDCGQFVTVPVSNLASGNTTSCGCYAKERQKACNMKHGKSRTPEYIMWQMAKHRAAEKGIPFAITVNDVVIPERCPMLNIPLFQANGVLHDNSPTLDRRNGLKGYVKGNVRVISYKANRSKSNLTLDEMKLMVKNW
jgi:hypothetical protein